MIKAVVGANWGDEGKGKITDMLAKEADIIVRFQGGANAGHTIVNDYGKFALHTLPSGVFYNHTTSVIGNGVALNVPLVFKEIQDIYLYRCQESVFRLRHFFSLHQSVCHPVHCRYCCFLYLPVHIVMDPDLHLPE